MPSYYYMVLVVNTSLVLTFEYRELHILILNIYEHFVHFFVFKSRDLRFGLFSDEFHSCKIISQV